MEQGCACQQLYNCCILSWLWILHAIKAFNFQASPKSYLPKMAVLERVQIFRQISLKCINWLWCVLVQCSSLPGVSELFMSQCSWSEGIDITLLSYNGLLRKQDEMTFRGAISSPTTGHSEHSVRARQGLDVKPQIWGIRNTRTQLVILYIVSPN